MRTTGFGRLIVPCFVCMGLILMSSLSFGEVTKAVRFAWDDPNNKVAPAGYRIFESYQTGDYDFTQWVLEQAGIGTDENPASVEVLADGKIHYFVVTAYNEIGQSGPSNEVNLQMPLLNPPGIPQRFRLVMDFYRLSDGSWAVKNLKIKDILDPARSYELSEESVKYWMTYMQGGSALSKFIPG